MELEIGMYLRSFDGISRVIEVKNDGVMTRVVNEDGNVYFINDMLCNPSHNLLALIKVGDIINKKQVVKIIHFEGDTFYRIELFGGKAIMNVKDIETIVTKEQFERMAYKVGE